MKNPTCSDFFCGKKAGAKGRKGEALLKMKREIGFQSSSIELGKYCSSMV